MPDTQDPLSEFFSSIDRVVGGITGDAAPAEDTPPAPLDEGKPADVEVKGDVPSGAPADEQAPPATQNETLGRALARQAKMEAELVELRKLRKQAEAAPKDGPPPPVNPSAFAIQLRQDPLKALQSVGLSEEEAANTVRSAMADIMGDKAPDVYRKIRNESTVDARFRLLEKQNQDLMEEIRKRDEQASQAQATAAQAQIVREFTTNVESYLRGDGTNDAPLSARLFAADRDSVVSEVMQVVMADAQEKISQGYTNAAPLTPAEAIKIVEARHARLREVYMGNKNSTNTAARSAAPAPGITNAPRGIKPVDIEKRALTADDVDAEITRVLRAQGLA